MLKVNAHRVENEDHSTDNPSYTYTVQLRAEYGDVELASKTTIQYCDRLATPECGKAITVNVNDKFKLAEEPAKVD